MIFLRFSDKNLTMSGSVQFSECPPSLKSIVHYLKTASEHDSRDIIVAYWSRLYALQLGLKLSSQKPEETKLFLGKLPKISFWNSLYKIPGFLFIRTDGLVGKNEEGKQWK